MKNVIAFIAIIALMVFGLSPPIQDSDLDQYDQTEFCQSIDQDATFDFDLNIPVAEDVQVTVLKYPTTKTAIYDTQVGNQNMELQSNELSHKWQKINSMTKSATKMHKAKISGTFQLEIGELNNISIHT